ncbi:hypothetical protein Pint_23828 [Pistacia integerrima]|uniref:Uncharacterized protein n=1 Tax=Pistacia integerrima TaxID=434235 RepID=A0ACC0YKQ5_9ROSI|nr:hypothetical protein Pint_23828 [Pistacia integerrima]
MAAEFFLRSGSFPSGFLQQLLDKLEPPELTHFIRKHKLDEAWLKKLKKTISTINAVIHDAEKKQFRNPEVSDWLSQITDVCYDIEDLLDQIATQALRSKLEAESRAGTTWGATRQTWIKRRMYYSNEIESAAIL